MRPQQMKSLTGNIDVHQTFLNYCFSHPSASPVTMVCRHLKTKWVFLLSQTRGWPCSSSGSCRPKGSRWQKAGSGNLFWTTSLNQGLPPLIRVPRRTSRAKLYLRLWQIIPCKIYDYCYVFCWFVREKNAVRILTFDYFLDCSQVFF